VNEVDVIEKSNNMKAMMKRRANGAKLHARSLLPSAHS
jgi:hypothetical protein